MSEKYLVGPGESEFEQQDFVILEAADKEGAVSKYIKEVGISDEGFQEYVYSWVPNASIATEFWFATQDEENALLKDGSVIATVEDFEGRVREYFGAQTHFADLFVEHWQSRAGKKKAAIFPDEMLSHLWLNSNWSPVVAFKVSEIEEI